MKYWFRTINNYVRGMRNVISTKTINTNKKWSNASIRRWRFIFWKNNNCKSIKNWTNWDVDQKRPTADHRKPLWAKSWYCNAFRCFVPNSFEIQANYFRKACLMIPYASYYGLSYLRLRNCGYEWGNCERLISSLGAGAYEVIGVKMFAGSWH